MNQPKMIILPSRLNPHDIVSGSPLGDFASDRPGLRSSVHALACSVRGMESADATTFGQGRCR
jgi:hypothetical protein